MSDRETGHMVKDCIICMHFDPIWEGDGDTGDEEIVYYCQAGGFKEYRYALPTKRVVCESYEMTGDTSERVLAVEK